MGKKLIKFLTDWVRKIDEEPDAITFWHMLSFVIFIFVLILLVSFLVEFFK